jgi:hypothetical protein
MRPLRRTGSKVGSGRRWGGGEVEKWRNGEMERWIGGEVERWRDGEMEKWRILDRRVSRSVVTVQRFNA